MEQHSILLVDDDPIITAGIGMELEEKGYQVQTANSGEEAILFMNEATFDLVITDLVMASVDGMEVLEKAKEINPLTMVIILTGFGDMNSAIDALRLEADDYILKPCEPAELELRVSQCLEKLELNRRIATYEHMLPVCRMCKKIMVHPISANGTADWVEMEKYIHDKGKTEIKSSYCPDCARDFKDLGVDIGADPGDL